MARWLLLACVLLPVNPATAIRWSWRKDSHQRRNHVSVLSDKLLLCDGCWTRAQMLNQVATELKRRGVPLHAWASSLSMKLLEVHTAMIYGNPVFPVLFPVHEYEEDPKAEDLSKGSSFRAIDARFVEDGRPRQLFLPVKILQRQTGRGVLAPDGSPALRLITERESK